MKLENMSEFNFKSSPCTSIEQSERLLALGLKEETADCCWTIDERDNIVIRLIDEAVEYIEPAWSLGRLIKLMPRTIVMHFPTGEVLDTPIERFIYAQGILTSDDSIAEAVSIIEWLIKEGYFNKEYLV